MRAARSRVPSERRDGLGGEPAAGVDGFVARLGLGDPGLPAGARGLGGSLASSASAPRTLPCAGALLDAGQDRVAVVAARLVDRADADELLGVGLQPFEKAAVARRLARGAQHRLDDRGELLRQRGVARHAGRGERLERRERRGSVASGLTMASSAANGSPRSTASRSAAAATARRTARSLPAPPRARRSAGRSAAADMRSEPALAVAQTRASRPSLRRDSAATLSASDLAAFSVALRRPSTTGSVTGARGAACALSSRASRAAMSSIALGSTLAGAGRAARLDASLQLLFDRGKPRAEIDRRPRGRRKRAGQPDQHEHQQRHRRPRRSGC